MNENPEEVYRGKALTLNLELANYPDGSNETLEIVRHPGGAGAIAINKQEKVCLIRQYRHAVEDWLWEIPAGKIELEENPLETAKRELLEEAGLTAGTWEALGKVLPSPGICDERIFLYLATDLSEKETAHESTEFIEIHWLPFMESIKMIEDGTITDAKTVISLYNARQWYKNPRKWK